MPTRARADRMPPDRRRAAIVDATLPLVLEHGTKVTVRLIAEAAGVAEGTIFTVFRDKDELMDAVLEKGFDPALVLRELAGIDRGLPLRERLEQVVRVVQRRLHRAFLLIAKLGLTRPPGGRDDRELNEQFIDVIVAVIGPDHDRLRVTPAELARLLRLLTFSATHPLINDGYPLSARQIVDVLLDGVHRPSQSRTDTTTPAA